MCYVCQLFLFNFVFNSYGDSLHMGHSVSDQPIFLLNLRDPPPISMKFGTLADNAKKNSVNIFRDVCRAVSEI